MNGGRFSHESDEHDLIELKNTVNNFYLLDETACFKRVSIKTGDEGTRVSIETFDRASELRADKLKRLDEAGPVPDDGAAFSKAGRELDEDARLLEKGLGESGASLVPEILRMVDEKASLASAVEALKGELAEANRKLAKSERESREWEQRTRELERDADDLAARAEVVEKRLSGLNDAFDALVTKIAGRIATAAVLVFLLFILVLVVLAVRSALSSQDPGASMSSLFVAIISVALAFTPIRWRRSVKEFCTKHIRGRFDKHLP